ncbi:serine acetyltransferase [Sphingobium sp. SCG-1]|uniref:serine O-acetyltransferase n=1 Tax=Sphingobium sp. SCG-1 TaxID=2072936 RepID=UPI000CD68977|nr:DapH/DapD/GlmU-related protein [Sphingobium sp. SCG-1]AUW57335.1 serine acetyltransferase [Sphingobium sp. SCG-1]
MIQSKADLDRYVKADLAIVGITRWRLWMGLRYPLLRYQRILRKTEYAVNCTRGPLRKPYVFLRQYLLRRAGMKLGFTIHPNIFGPGLSIAHWGTIVINPNVRIGANCRIHPSTSLGEYKGGSPQLGDDCYIGPGAKLFGPITLGDRVKIGANAVVTKSFPSDVVLRGIPADIVKPRVPEGN